MHHIHVTEYKNGRQFATSLYGFRGIPYAFRDANEARRRASEAHAMLNRLAKDGSRYDVQATGTPEWFLETEAR